MRIPKQTIQRCCLFVCMAFVGWSSTQSVPAQSSYVDEVQAWRLKRSNGLQSDSSWLSLVGLFWLKDGANTIGSGPDNAIVLPPASAPEKLGVIDFDAGVARLRVASGGLVTVDDKQVTSAELISDDNEHPTVMRTGTLSIVVIKRDDRIGVRVKDKQSPTLKSFRGLDWFLVREDYRVIADFTPYVQEKTVAIPNVLGGSYKMKSPGLLTFTLNGKHLQLEPVLEDGQLSIIFRDATSGKSTYGAGRFLDADLAVDGKVTLDFNKAYNPPCAFTSFATCPLPPPQNRLSIAIEAGEKKYAGHHPAARH